MAEELGTEPFVAAGHTIAQRLYELAYEIDLKQAEALWAGQERPASSRARLQATPPKAMSFGVPPLTVPLPPMILEGADGRWPASMTARLFDFGVVSLSLRVEAPAGPWEGFVGHCNAIALAADPDNPLWARAAGEVQRIFGPALRRPINWLIHEDYLLAVVTAFGENLSAASLQERVDLARLLSGENARLSEGARADLLRARFSYFPNDLVALSWDRALIVEPRGDTDVADVLEVANAQLLEMRYYDELLDFELPRMYERVSSARGAAAWLSARRYARLARQFTTLVAEVTELTEKVDNALQVTEDVYLARVYAAALELFRVPRLNAAVDRKLAIIRDIYTALYDEASDSRSAVMEIAIVGLIVAEIVLALVRH